MTLFAADGSYVAGVEVVRLGIDSAQLRPTLFSRPQSPDPALSARERAYFLRITYEIRRRSAEFDVVHNHAFDVSPFELLPIGHSRIIHTLHLPPVVQAVSVAANRARATGAQLVTVSHWAGDSWIPHVGETRVIRNGVPVRRIPLGTAPREGWLFVGRIAPEKGLEHALTAAEQAGRTLRVIGSVYDDSYYERVQPRLSRHDVLGPLPRQDVFSRMAAAEGLLAPACWDEPFGLTAVEAMAAGTPVAAYERGALPEVIADRRTGFVVPAEDVTALTQAAKSFHAIDPRTCRLWVQEQFGLSRVLDEHIQLYEELRHRR